MPDFRCSVASHDDGEPIAGTAPTDTTFLLVEHAGSWGRKAVAESRLPEAVRDHLGALDGVRVQLIRRHGGESGPGVRVFHARATADGFDVRTVVLPDAEALLDLDLDGDLDRGPRAVRRPALAGLHQRPPRPVLRRGRPAHHRGAGRAVARGDVGDHAPRRPPVLRDPARPPVRPHPRPSRPRQRRRGVRRHRPGRGARPALPRPGRPHPARAGARAAPARRRRRRRRGGRGAGPAPPRELRGPGREAHHAMGGPVPLTGLPSGP